MPRSPLHIALFQYDIQWENPLANRLLVEELYEELGETPDLLLLPEMFSTGFTMNVNSMAEFMSGDTVQWLLESAQKWQCEIMGSLIIEDQGHYFNRLLWVNSEGIRGTYDKRHLFALAGEDQVFSPGKAILEDDLKGWKIKPLICYDLRFPVWSRTRGETDILVYIANFPEKRRHAWTQLLVARAIENQCFVIGLNRVGWDGMQHHYSGDSVVLDPLGKPVLDLGDTPQSIQLSIDDHLLEQVRHELPFHRDADNFTIEV